MNCDDQYEVFIAYNLTKQWAVNFKFFKNFNSRYQLWQPPNGISASSVLGSRHPKKRADDGLKTNNPEKKNKGDKVNNGT